MTKRASGLAMPKSSTRTIWEVIELAMVCASALNVGDGRLLLGGAREQLFDAGLRVEIDMFTEDRHPRSRHSQQAKNGIAAICFPVYSSIDMLPFQDCAR